MQLFLFLEPEDLAGFFVQHAGDAVEGRVMEVRIEGGDDFDRPVEGLAEGQTCHQPAERIRAAVYCHDDLAVIHRFGVLDDEHVRVADAADHALGIAADHAVFHRADAQRAHDDQIVGVRIDIFDEHFPIAPFEGFAFDREVGLVALLVDVVEVGVRDDLESSRDQRVVDLPLAVQFLFIVIFLRQSRFHLLEALVVHLRRVDVAADNLGAEGFRELDAHVDRCIGMVGIIDRDIDGLIH